jgi:putative chitinase
MITAQLLKAAFPLCKAPDKWPVALNAAMEKYGVNNPSRIACFLAQIGHESGQLNKLEENLYYKTAARICFIWPSRFYEKEPDANSSEEYLEYVATRECAALYVKNPEALANKVYAGRMGNTAPGDGWKHRGRGLIQLTGKANYEAQGITNPDDLLAPQGAAMSAAKYWSDRHCNELADDENMVGLTKKITGGMVGLAERVSLFKAIKKLLI